VKGIVPYIAGAIVGCVITSSWYTLQPTHYPKYEERLEQCEALLGKAVNLTTQCVNQREAERCPK
jgi:hypothetical protein